MNQRLRDTALYATMPFYSGYRRYWYGLPERKGFLNWLTRGIR